jgi:hypothetical protein
MAENPNSGGDKGTKGTAQPQAGAKTQRQLRPEINAPAPAAAKQPAIPPMAEGIIGEKTGAAAAPKPSPKPTPVRKSMPTAKVPGFLSRYERGAAAYNKYLFPTYLKISKILSKTMKEYILGKLHSKIQGEIRHLRDFSDDDEVREEVLAKFIKQLAVHVLEYEERASDNLRKKEPEMKAVSPEDINYIISSFEFHPWDK